ncbi:hypothetical protein [Spirochaeta cellobiosiphila]|uniref:hypothetical protein n=1 Tax=Spirochaeta cellobiosiphila TaxID=504483 RepID=UPI000405090B|nr:hypothetical protein [Spirochaeta cellobiosiphila]
MKKLLLLFLFIIVQRLGADPIINQLGQYSIYLPVGWKIVDNTNDFLWSFSSSDGKIACQIGYYTSKEIQGLNQLVDLYSDQFVLVGDSTDFKYRSYKGVLGFYDFVVNAIDMTGVFAFVETKDGFLGISCFTLQNDFDNASDIILSTIDSVRILPIQNCAGIISVASHFKQDNEKGLVLDNRYIFYDQNSIKVSQIIIEREARILASYGKNDFTEAWIRYYQLIYEDNYERLDVLSSFLDIYWSEYSETERIQKLVSWVQNFKYTRSELFSDLLSPVATAYEFSGDCDSRSLLIISILEHWGVESILMVSEEYSHAMVGISMDYTGAQFNFNSRKYVVAETTESVSIGLIGSNVADPSKWLGVSFWSRSR